MPAVASPESEALRQAWCGVLDVANVAPSDSFFDFGDSISGLRLIAKLRERGFALRLAQLYENPTFAELAPLVSTATPQPSGRPAGSPAEATAEPGRSSRMLVLLPVQQRTLEYDRIDPDFHNDDAVWAIPPDCTVDGITAALEALVRRHPGLGSCFHRADGQWRQELGRPLQVDSAVQVVPVEPGDAERIAELGAAAHRSFALTEGRVFAARILTWQDRPWALAVVIHHLVCDAMSWDVIAADLADLIDGRSPAGSATPAAADDGYRAWVDYLVGQAGRDAYREQLPYWRARPWARVTRLPRLADDADRTMGNLHTLRTSTDLGDGVAFRRAARAWGGDAVVIGALNYALRTVFGADASLMDVVINGRDQLPGAPDISRTVGWFAEFIPVVTDLAGARSAGEILASSAAQLHAMPEPRIAFGSLRQLSPNEAIRREFQQLPKAELYLNYRGAMFSGPGGPLAELDYSLGAFQSPRERAPYPLKVICDLRANTLAGQWKFSTAELDEAHVRALSQAFCAALEQLPAIDLPA